MIIVCIIVDIRKLSSIEPFVRQLYLYTRRRVQIIVASNYCCFIYIYIYIYIFRALCNYFRFFPVIHNNSDKRKLHQQ